MTVTFAVDLFIHHSSVHLSLPFKFAQDLGDGLQLRDRSTRLAQLMMTI
jgi:hypothetical protein